VGVQAVRVDQVQERGPGSLLGYSKLGYSMLAGWVLASWMLASWVSAFDG